MHIYSTITLSLTIDIFLLDLIVYQSHSLLQQAHLEKTENDIQELSQNGVNLKSNYLELTEFQHVLEKTQVFFTEVPKVVQQLLFVAPSSFV